MERRNFIRGAAGLALAGAAVSAAACRTREDSGAAVPPSDSVSIAVIGLRNIGWHNLLAHLKVPGVVCLALCDVDRSLLETRAAELEKISGRRPDIYGDFRKMLERRDLDAVIIGTPDHWHTLMTIYAMEAGIDVYVEKPLANSIEECMVLEKAAARYQRVVQVGQQQRSEPHWNTAAGLIRSGELGRVANVKAFLNYGHSRELAPQPDSAPPEGVDYDLWLGPAPLRPFNPNRFHGSWRYFWDYGGGIMTDWGVHLIDMVLMFMDVSTPASVLSTGGKFTFPASAMEAPDNQVAVYRFGDFIMSWEHTMGIGFWPYEKHHGVVVYGEKGMLLIDRDGFELRSNASSEAESGILRYKTSPLPRQRGQGDGRGAHAANFIHCVRSREKPACDMAIGINVAINAHLGNIAYRLGRSVAWDSRTRTFPADTEAAAMMKANYREPWKLPVL